MDFDFWLRGVTYCCYLHMVATGELCCLSDNSGYSLHLAEELMGSLCLVSVCLCVCLSGSHTLVEVTLFYQSYNKATYLFLTHSSCGTSNQSATLWSFCLSVLLSCFAFAGSICVLWNNGFLSVSLSSAYEGQWQIPEVLALKVTPT